jgi:hypothetical protein
MTLHHGAVEIPGDAFAQVKGRPGVFRLGQPTALRINAGKNGFVLPY